MDLDTIRQFVAAAGYMNFSMAAKTCNVTQPTLSRNIAVLEKEIGQRLFDRDVRLTLTPAGKLALRRLSLVLQEYDMAMEELKALRVASPVTLVVQDVSMIPSANRLVSHALRRIKEAESSIDITTTSGVSKDMVHELVEGRIDIGFIWSHAGIEPEVTPGISATRVEGYDEYVVLAVEGTHPLAMREHVRLADYASERFLRIVPPYDQAIYRSFSLVCERHGFSPKFEGIATTGNESYWQQQLNGGVLLIPQSMIGLAGMSFSLPENLALPQVEDEPLRLDLYVLSRTDETNRAVPLFIDALTHNAH